MKIKKFNIILIAFTISSLGFFWLGIINLHPEGYRIDIYSQLGLDVILGFLVIYSSLMTLQRLTDNSTLKSLYIILLLISYFAILLSPRLLGYYLTDRGDSLHSIGYIRTILLSGHTDKLDIYPSNWIMLSVVRILSGLSLDNVILLSILVNNIIYVFFFLVLSRKFNIDLLTYFAFGFLLGYYHGTIIAEHFAYVLNLAIVYLLLDLYHKYHKLDTRVLLVLTIFLITIVFAHPFVAFFDLGLLLLLYLSTKLTNLMPRKNTYAQLLLIYSIILIVWVSWQRLLISNVLSIPVFIKKMLIFRQLSYATSVSGVSKFDMIRYFILRYWGQMWLYIVVLILLIVFFKNYKNVLARRLISIPDLSLAMWSLIFTCILFLMRHGYDRILGLNFMIIGAVVIIFQWYPRIVAYKWRDIICLIIILVIPFSLFSLFYSPLIGMPNSGITYGELTGAKFAFLHLDSNSKLIDPIGESKRWSIWWYGYSETFRQEKVLYLYKLPDHFGYNNVACFSQNEYIERFEHNIFGYAQKYKFDYTKLLVVVPDYPIEMYEKAPLFEYMGRFKYEDENRLRSDYSVNFVYAGANLRLYKPIPCNQ